MEKYNSKDAVEWYKKEEPEPLFLWYRLEIMEISRKEMNKFLETMSKKSKRRVYKDDCDKQSKNVYDFIFKNLYKIKTIQIYQDGVIRLHLTDFKQSILLNEIFENEVCTNVAKELLSFSRKN